MTQFHGFNANNGYTSIEELAAMYAAERQNITGQQHPAMPPQSVTNINYIVGC
jgi:hypothetical protein